MFSGSVYAVVLNVTTGLPSRRCLWIVDVDSDMPSSSRVFLTSVDTVKGFVFTEERILQSFALVVFQVFQCC